MGVNFIREGESTSRDKSKSHYLNSLWTVIHDD